MPEQGLSRFEQMRQGFKEAIGNGFERIQNGLESVKKEAERLQAIGQIAAVGVGAGLALPGAVSAEGPVGAPDVEAAASSQSCVDQAFRMKIKRAEMSHPGDKKKQSAILEVGFRPLSDGCQDVVNGITGKASFRVQRPSNPKKLISTSSRKMIIPRNVDEKGGTGVAAVGNVVGPWKVKNPNFRYQCITGPAKNKPTVKVRRTVHLNNGRNINRVNIIPLRVKRNPHLTSQEKRRGAVRGAC